MTRKRPARVKRVRRIPSARKDGGRPITRAEFDAVITLLNERREIINKLRREVHSTCRDLASQVEQNRRTLEVQFARIAQLQQEIDAIKRRG